MVDTPRIRHDHTTQTPSVLRGNSCREQRSQHAPVFTMPSDQCPVLDTRLFLVRTGMRWWKVRSGVGNGRGCGTSSCNLPPLLSIPPELTVG
jgi:hypothetical protein